MRDVFNMAEEPDNSPGLIPRARAARAWLSNVGLQYRRIGRGVYVDGHEGEDVRQYRQQDFDPRWLELRKRFLKFDLSSTEWRAPTDLGNEKPINDESFSANDATSHGWLKDGQVPLRPKGKGKGIMVSAF